MRTLTTLLKIPTEWLLILLLATLALAGSGFAQAIDVTLPEASAPAGKNKTIYVDVGNTTGRGVYSCDLTIAFDPSLLSVNSVSTGGTIASIWGPPTYRVENGQIHVGMGGTDALSGSGHLLRIDLHVADNANVGQSTQLAFVNFQFNEGSPAATTHDGSFTVIPDTEPPVFTQGPVIRNVTSHSADVVFRTDEPAKAVIEYGSDTNYGNTITLDDYRSSRSVTIHPLAPSTQYHCRVSVTDEHGNGPTVSEDLVFSTSDIVVSLPEIVGDPGVDVLVPVNVTDLSEQDVTQVHLVVEYAPEFVSATSVSTDGTIASAWPQPTFSASPGRLDISLSGATPLTGAGALVRITFHVADNAPVGHDVAILISEASLNNGFVPSVRKNGKLLIRDTLPPVIQTGPTVEELTAHTARIVWQTNERATSVVEFGTTASYGHRREQAGLASQHAVVLRGLRPEVTYHFRVASTDSSGNGPTYSDDATFTTPAFAGPVLQLPDTTVHSGDAFDLPLVLRGTPDQPLRELKYFLSFDPVLLEFVRVDPNNGLLGDWQIVEERHGSGFVAFHARSGSPVTSAGVLMTLRFQAAPGVLGDKLSPVRFLLAEANGRLLEIGAEDASVTVRGTPDNTPPVFLDGPVVEASSTSGVRVRWVVDEPGRYVIDYGSTTSYGSTVSGTCEDGFNEAAVTDLTPGATYHFRVSIWDARGNGPSRSEDVPFQLPAAQDVTVRLDRQSHPPGAEFDWPILTTDLSGKAVYSADIAVRFNPDVLECLSASTQGTRASGWGDPVYTISAGKIIVAMGGIDALTGSGALVKIRFKVKPDAPFGATSLVWFEKFVYNEGTPATRYTGNVFTVRDNLAPALTDGPATFGIARTRASVYWVTDEPATTLLDYGLTSVDENHVVDTELKRVHVLELDNLEPGATYVYQVGSVDATGNGPTQSREESFATAQAAHLVLAAGHVAADRGQTFNLPIRLTENTGADVYSLKFNLTFPAYLLEYLSASQVGCLTQGWPAAQVSLTDSTLHVEMSGTAALSDTGCILNLQMRVRSAGVYGASVPLLLSSAFVNGEALTTGLVAGTFVLTDRTPPAFTEPPSALDVQNTSATVVWASSEPARAKLHYGTTTAYGTTVQQDTFRAVQRLKITGLQPGTTYHCKVSLWDTLGNGPTESGDFTFSTSSGNEVRVTLPTREAPIGDTVRVAVQVSDVGAFHITKFNFALKVPHTSFDGASVETRGSLTETWPSPQVLYQGDTLRVVAEGAQALSGQGALVWLVLHVRPDAPAGTFVPLLFFDFSFNDGTVPVIASGTVWHLRDVTPPRFVGQPSTPLVTAHTAIIAWETDELSTGLVDYGTSTTYGNSTRDDTVRTAHQVTLLDLTPATTYHFRVSAWDTAGNGPTRSDDLIFQTLSETVNVRLPQVEAARGAEVDVPVMVSQLTGFGIKSWTFAVSFNPAYLSPLGATTVGTLSEAWGSAAFSASDTVVTVSASGSSALSGNGILVWLRFSVSGAAQVGQTLSLHWVTFRFNSGYPKVATEDGTVLVKRGAVAGGIPVTLPDTTLSRGETALLPLYVGNVTGKGIYSVQGTLRFRTAVVQIDQVLSASSLTQNWGSPSYTSGPDSIAFSISGSEALADSGVLMWVRASVPEEASPGDTTTLTLVHFRFNQGRPAADVRNGRVRVRRERDVISGRVVNARTEQPIPDALVTAVGEATGSHRTARSTASGVFRLTDLDTTETYTVWATADSFTSSDTLRGVPAGTQNLVFRLVPKDGQILGWVRERGTAYPLSGAVLVADDGHGHYASTNSDSVGFFLLRSLPRVHPYALTVTKFGYRDTTVAGLLPDTTLTVLLTPLTGRIHGWVKLRDGSPLPQVPVYARSTTVSARVESTLTTAQGEFTFDQLVVDRYLVYPVKAGYVSKPAQETVTLNPNATVELSFQLKEAVLASLVLDGPSEIPNDQPSSYSYTALTDSGETIVLAQVHWQLVPNAAGTAVSGKVYPNPAFFGPASVIVTDPLTGIADTLGVLIYAAVSTAAETRLHDDTGLRLVMPAGALEQSEHVYLERPDLPGLKKYANEGSQVGFAYKLRPSGVEFSKAVTLSLPLPAHQGNGNFVAAEWRESDATWQQLETGQLTDSSITVNVTHLGLFSVLRLSEPLGVRDVRFAPNPFSPLVDTDGDGHPGVRISFVANSNQARQPFATVTVHNAVGQIVRKLLDGEPVAKGTPTILYWDGRTDAGYEARNGRYFVRIQVRDPSGTKEYLGSIVLVK